MYNRDKNHSTHVYIVIKNHTIEKLLSLTGNPGVKVDNKSILTLFFMSWGESF